MTKAYIHYNYFLRDILVLNEVSAEMIADPEQMEAIEGMRELLKYSVIIAASIPVLIAYPFVQKFFVKGTMAAQQKVNTYLYKK